MPEAQGSRNNITHFIVPSFSNSARSAVWLPFPSRRTTWVASPGTATGRTPTPAKACNVSSLLESIKSSFKLLLGWHCKASLSQARNTAFIIICHHCSSIYVHQLSNYLQLSQINSVNTAPLGGVPRPRFGAAAPRRGIGTLPTAAVFDTHIAHFKQTVSQHASSESPVNTSP